MTAQQYRGLGLTTTQTAQTVMGIAATAIAPVPVVGQIGAAVLSVASAITGLLGQGCGQTCIETSQWANQAANVLGQNLSAYFSEPIPRSPGSQQQALANFDAVWNQLNQLCSQPGLGTAGKNCIADRQSGACKWKAAAPAYPGEPAQGACWNWFNGYRDPIANDPNVGSTATSAVSGAASAISSATGIDPTLLLIGGAALLLLVVLS